MSRCVLPVVVIAFAGGVVRAVAPAVDDGKVAAAGIRKIVGKHLTLYTDLPSSRAVDELPDVFDQAFPQWCKFFEHARRAEQPGGNAEAADRPLSEQPWHVTACVIGDKRRFAAVGLLPDDLPPFLHAFYRGDRLWVYDQPTDYYRRHLLLHEGTHAFEDHFFGTIGPPWYAEGKAELLATHAWKDSRLTMNYFPADADEVPGWGRIRLVHDAIAAGRRLRLDDVMAYNDRAHVEVEPYGWCFAALALLEHTPRYRGRFHRFRDAAVRLQPAEVNDALRKEFATDWAQLAEEWQLYTTNLDYGYDFMREAIEFREGKPLPATGATAMVAANLGWESTAIALEAGKSYRITAKGRYQVAREPRPWWCEPDGVTIRYWQGHPLGRLMAAVHPDQIDPRRLSPFLFPESVGHEAVIKPTENGTLYLRINDAAAELSDNSGSVEVRVTAE